MEALIYPPRSSITEWFCQSARVTIALSRFRTDEHFAFSAATLGREETLHIVCRVPESLTLIRREL